MQWHVQIVFAEGHLVDERFLKPHVQYMKGSMHDHQTWPGPALHVIDFLGQKVDFMDQIRNPSFLRNYFFPSRSRGAS